MALSVDGNGAIGAGCSARVVVLSANVPAVHYDTPVHSGSANDTVSLELSGRQQPAVRGALVDSNNRSCSLSRGVATRVRVSTQASEAEPALVTV